MDLIERHTAIDAIKNADVIVFYDEETTAEDATEVAIVSTKKSVVASIEELPSTQPEQKTGKWIKKKSMIYCTSCYNGFEAIFIRDYNFCPKCGADMRGEQNE